MTLGDSGKEELTFSRKKHEADEGSVKGSHLLLLAGKGWTGNLAHQSFAQDALMHLVQQSLVWEKQGKGLTKNLREKNKKTTLKKCVKLKNMFAVGAAAGASTVVPAKINNKPSKSQCAAAAASISRE